MARYVRSSSAYTYTVNFKVGEELVVPASATITITKNDGSVVGSYNAAALSLDSGATSKTITISGVDNTPALPNEMRYIDVAFVYAGATYHVYDHYLLRSNVRFPLTEDDVRAALGGVSPTEIADSSIDILRAYDLVQVDVGETNLPAILEGGTSLLPDLIEAVKLKAALLLVPTLQTAVFQMEQADNTLYRRFEKVDFTVLETNLRSRYDRMVLNLQGVETSADYALAGVYNSTDPVTGA